MSKTSPYARIAITLPKRDLAAADRLAQSLDRPRSWVVAEAIRRFTAAPPVAASTPVSPQPGLGPSRLAQLTADLALSPEERVRAAEETLRLSEESNKRARTLSLRMFDTYLDYIDFKRRRIDER